MKVSSKFIRHYGKYMSVMGIAGQGVYVFQAIKILYTGSSQDVSLTGFLFAFVAITSWLIYGVLMQDKVLILVNLVGFFSSLACVLAIIFV